MGPSLAGPYQFRARIQSFQSFAAAFPADPIRPLPAAMDALGMKSVQDSAPAPDIVGPRLAGPYQFQARIQCFQAFAAAFPRDRALPP